MTDFDRLKKILSEQLSIDEEKITEQTSIADLGADSLDIVEAMMNVEEEFGVTIEDGAIENLKTVGDFLELITNK